MEKILIRDEKGKVYNKVDNPAVVFFCDTGTLIRIGEKEVMKSLYDEIISTSRAAGFKEYAKDIAMMELTKDQELIDNVFQITGFIQTIWKRNS